MNRSLALSLALSLLVSSGCAKDKGKTEATSPEGALSSQNQCESLACQTPPKKDKPVANNTDPAPVPAPNTPEDKEELNDTQKMVRSATLTCKNGDCDPSVGLLSIALRNENNAWSAGQCTASLIAPNVLVTNGHCIPNDLVKEGSNCLNRMWVTFANDPAHPEYTKQVRCSKVMFRRKDGNMDGADYAYIELEKATNRPFNRQSRSGFEDKKNYHLHKINPVRVSGGISGLMEKVDCLSLYESAIFPTVLDSISQTNMFVDCRVIPGNSGAPILADDGTVRGVIYAFVKKEQIRKIFDKNGSSIPEESLLADLNVGSNFACLNAPGDLTGRELPVACANGAQRLAAKRAAAEAARVAALRPAAKTMIDEKKTGHKDIAAFGWTLTTSNSEKLGPMGLGAPECVHLSNAMAMLDKPAPIKRPFFFIRADYDKYMRASNYGLVWGGFSTTPEEMLVKLISAQRYVVAITDPDSAQMQFTAELPICSVN